MNKTIKQMKKNTDFQDFIVDLNTSSDFVDATYFLRQDGTLVFSEGYYHEIEKNPAERRLISHIVYAPITPASTAPDYTTKRLFGLGFENITKEIMANNPLDKFYPLQLQRYIELDPTQQKQPRQFFSRYKALVPVSELVGAFPTLHSLQTIISRADRENTANNIRVVTEQTAKLLGIGVDRIGISGSLSLGCYADPHDLDFVIHGSADEVASMVKFMQELTDREEKRRVYESGKFWPIRFWDYNGDEKFMVCPFFSYLDPKEAPLRNFSFEELGEVSFQARVADDTHNAFNPTILDIEEVKTHGPGEGEVARLILYHGGERGDWRKGNRIKGTGMRCLVRTFKIINGERSLLNSYNAIIINNLDQISPAEKEL